MKKIIRKIWNVLVLIKNFLLILFQLKDCKAEIIEFIDETIKDISLANGEEERRQVVDNIKELLNKIYGSEFIIQHTTLSLKLVDKLSNYEKNQENDFVKELKECLKNSYDLKSFLILFVK